MKIYYRNSKGQTIDFTGLTYRISESDLYDYEWAYETKTTQTSKIYWFHKNVTEKNIKIAISADSQKSYVEYGNKLLSVFEYDIINLTPGRLYVNDMYISCYIYKSKKSQWMPGINFLVNEFSLISEDGKWIKVEHHKFNATTLESYATDNGLDYPYDYPYDYANGAVNKVLYNNSFIPCDLEMTVYGSCSNPVISIGEISYEVNTDIAVGEYLKINTLEKKIYKVKINGEKINLFHYRGRERTNFFEKIPPGKHPVLWNGSYTFDVDLFYERSEPVWI